MLIRLAGFLKYTKFVATFMLVISAVSCGGGSSSSGNGGGAIINADPSGDYSGTWKQGGWFGYCSGSWQFKVEYSSGTLTGRTEDCTGDKINLYGTIDSDWNITFGNAGGHVATFEGKIYGSRFNVTGTWQSYEWGMDGTFTGQCSYSSLVIRDTCASWD